VICSIQEYCQLTQMPLSAFINDSPSSIKDGCCLKVKKHGINVVLYDASNINFERRNWSLAHEVGHVYLDHTEDGEIEEIEAHYFASQLFMPEFTLYMMKKNYGEFDAEDLAEIFGVSYSAAKKRLNSFKRMAMVNASKRDMAIWERQKEKIDLYFHCTRKCGGDFRGTLEMMNAYNEEMESLMYY